MGDKRPTSRPLLKVGPIYNDGVLVGNWVESRITCPKDCNLYFPPKEVIDYEKMKPESRQSLFRLNKLVGTRGNIPYTITHESHDGRGNFATTNDVVYRVLPKPLCGPVQRHYQKAPHQFYPQPDMLKCYGNATVFGLRNYKKYEWACTDVSDYNSSLYEDSYVGFRQSQCLQPGERKARNSQFTKTFLHKMTKPTAASVGRRSKAK